MVLRHALCVGLFLCLLCLLPLPSASAQVAEKITISTQLNPDFVRIVFKFDDVEKFDVSHTGKTLTIDFGSPVKASFNAMLLALEKQVESAAIKDKTKVELTLKDERIKIRKFTSKRYGGIDLLLPPPLPAKEQAKANPPKKASASAKTSAGKTTPAPGSKPGTTTSSQSPPQPPSGSAASEPKIVPQQGVYGPPQPSDVIATWLGRAVKAVIQRVPLLKPQTIVQETTPAAPPAAQGKILDGDMIGPLTQKDFEARVKESFSLPPPPPEPGDDWDGPKAETWSDPRDEEELAAHAEPDPIVEPEPEPEPEPVVEAPAPQQPQEASTEDVDLGKYDMAIIPSQLKDGWRLSFPWERRTAAAVYERGGSLWVVFDNQKSFNLQNLNKISYIKSAEQIFHRNYTILKFKTAVPENKKFSVDVYKDDFKWIVELKEEEQQPVALSVKAKVQTTTVVPKVFIAVPEAADPLKIVDPDVGDKLVVVPLYKDRVGVAPTRYFVDFTLLETHQGIMIPVITDETLVKVRRDGITISNQRNLNVFANAPGAYKTTEQTTLADFKPQQIHSIFPFSVASYDQKKEIIGVLNPDVEAEAAAEGENATKDAAAEKDKTPETKPEESEKAKAEDTETKDSPPEKPAETASAGKVEETLSGGKVYYETLHQLMTDVIETDDDALKLQRRLKLARFYFAHSLYAESLGVLEEIKSESSDPIGFDVSSLLATSHYLMGHYIEAAEIFKELASTAKPEEGLEELQLLWWASNNQIRPKSLQTTAKIPQRFYDNHQGFVSDYPIALRYDLGLLAAEDSINNGDHEIARGTLEFLTEVPSSLVDMNSAKFLESKILAKENSIDGAKEIWTELSQTIDDRYNRARATFEMYKYLYTQNEVDKQETIKNLDKLRVVWKGDDFELELLKFLGSLYIFENDYINGLRTWRELITQFPRSQDALAIARQMKKTFIELFENGEAFQLDPFTSLTLFFEFRELTPVGEKGDAIVRQLVDHFVAADLLENAAALLTHQVRFRAQGTEKVSLAIKLAQIHLTNKHPELTLEALDYVKDSMTGSTFADEYKYLRARAMVQLSQHYETLRLLEGDWSKTAQDLRLNIFLERQNWFGIMNIIEPRLAEVIDRGNPIKGESLRDLLLLSIAYATQQEQEKLLMVQNEFLDKIDDQNGRNVIAFVTNNQGAVNYLKFNTTVQFEDIANFVTNYLLWPSREWKSVIEILEPEIITITQRKDKILSQDEINQVIQLAIAYYMEQNTADDPNKVKNATKGLKMLQREFAKVQIDERSLPVFIALTQDPELIPSGALDTPTSIKNIETFVNNYRDMIEGKGSLL